MDAIGVRVEQQRQAFKVQRTGIDMARIDGRGQAKRCGQLLIQREGRHAHRRGAPGVERFALQGQHRLRARVAHRRDGAGGGFALDQEEFATEAMALAVGQAEAGLRAAGHGSVRRCPRAR